MPAHPTPTFRDPAGSLALEADCAVRTIHPDSRVEVLELLREDFLAQMIADGDAVDSTVDDGVGGLRLIHPRIATPTYPWEWTPSQWLAAANLTLRLCEQALDAGWILKDATPLNILFVGPQPVLVDVLSFEKRDPAATLWIAYGQYIRTFLLPLVMARQLHWPLALTLFHRDGYEPGDLFEAMSWPQRLSRDAFWPITLPAWLEKRSKPADVKAQLAAARKADPELTAHILRRSLGDLRRRTQRALPASSNSEWSAYTGTLTHYTAAESAAKEAWVAQVLDDLRPARVLDIGANTGDFSALAASKGADVVALERDAAAADRLFRRTQQQGLRVQTIHADLSRPTPAVGWENRESTSLLDRLEGGFDLVLMLAVIHHLILMEQIPIPAIVALAARMTRRYWLVEWVPATDPMFVSLMRGRDTLYAHLTLDDLLRACAPHVTLLRQETLTNGRVLLLFEKHGRPA